MYEALVCRFIIGLVGCRVARVCVSVSVLECARQCMRSRGLAIVKVRGGDRPTERGTTGIY